MNTYQLLPDLLPDEYESLRASIAERGVDVPIIVDQDGNTIDGFHRQRASDELKTFCPREVRRFTSEAEKYELVLRANCRRRQLNQRQKRELIGVYLRRDPQIADNSLGSLIGVSKNTVADVRHQLIATRQIDKLTKLRGKDGKERPSKYKRIIANTPKEAETALKVIGDLPESCEGKIFDVTTAKRRARRHQTEVRIAEPVPLPNPAIEIRHCRFQDLQATSAQLVLTDIPYDKAFLPEISELGAFASRVLIEGGVFVTYSGHYWLPEVMRRLGEHLTYRWEMASVWEGEINVVHTLGIASHWKPILVFSKGDWRKRNRWHDVLRVNGKEKKWHPWQQPLAEVEMLVRYFSNPEDLVIDPCGGGFTTAVACYRMGRRFIGCDVDADCVIRGQQRLAEAQLVDQLKVWIEDTDDVAAYLRKRGEPYNGQDNIRSRWKHGRLDDYLRMLPEDHQATWQGLAG